MMMQGDDTVSNSKGNVLSQAWKRLQQVCINVNVTFICYVERLKLAVSAFSK